MGQMHYAGRNRSFVGDFTARVSENDFQLDVTKGPGVPLLSLRESGTLARFEGGGHSWQGNPQHFVPGQLRGWLALHRALLEAARTPSSDGTRELPVQLGKGSVTTTGGAPARLHLELPASGERFAFQFSR